MRTVVGDVREAATLREALTGQEAVISTLGARRAEPVGTIRSAGTRALVEQMARAGVPRLIAVSAVGPETGRMTRPAALLWPVLVGRERLAEVVRAERIVRSSGLRWTLVRPPRLVDAPAGARIESGSSVRVGMNAQLGRADLARLLLDLLADEASVGTALTAVTRQAAPLLPSA